MKEVVVDIDVGAVGSSRPARDASSSRPISVITSILCIPGHEPYRSAAEAEKRSDVVQRAARAHNCGAQNEVRK